MDKRTIVACMATKAKTAAKPRGKAFPKGVSGNPVGSVATELRFESAFKRILAQALDAKTVEQYDGAINRMDRLAHKAIKILETTDNEQVFFAGLDKIADRTEGKPKQAVDVTSAGEKLEGILSNAQAEQLLRARANRLATEGDSD